MYPPDAITIYGSAVGFSSVLSGNNTILSTNISLFGGTESTPYNYAAVACSGGEDLFYFQVLAYSGGYVTQNTQSNYTGALFCQDLIIDVPDAGVTAYYEITYVPRLQASTTVKQYNTNIELGLAIIMVLGFLMFTAMIFNKTTKKR